MSTDQVEAASPTAGEAPEKESKRGPVREVNDFLADLDDVLATSTAPSIPAPAAEPDPAPDAAATMPDVDLDLEVHRPAEPAPGPDAATPAPVAAPAPVPARPTDDWWTDVYQDDAADQDTFTGNVPVRSPAPVAAPPTSKDASALAQPVVAEDGTDDEDGADEDETPEPKKIWTRWKKDQTVQDGGDPDDPDADEADGKEAPAPSATGGRFATAVKNAGPVIAGTANGGGVIDNPRGRQVVFAGTAYAAGWGLHLDDWVTHLMAHADQYATPVSGCALGLGVLGLATRSKWGGVLFVSSLGLITVLQMARPAWVVGGGVALDLQVAYRMVRGWVGRYGEKWPWKGVVWAAHVPAATATVAVLLFGTN
ncbi:hypothetical protein AB0A60_20010 [Streptomyces sp. NPDC046275]|uniref:hypothetical protein n=1 Tax=Streptomyces sp. NPDC046275 TaxID=3157201 RepID=UPI0033E2E638